MAEPTISWIEEPVSSSLSSRSPPDSSTESNATIVETTVFRIVPPEDEENHREFRRDVTVPVSAEGQFDPFIHIPRGRWNPVGSTASDPIPADDLESTSTVLTAATEDPKIYLDSDKEREHGYNYEDHEKTPQRAVELSRYIQSEPGDYPKEEEVPKTQAISVEFEGNVTQTNTFQARSEENAPCVTQTLEVTIKRVPRGPDMQSAEAKPFNLNSGNTSNVIDQVEGQTEWENPIDTQQDSFVKEPEESPAIDVREFNSASVRADIIDLWKPQYSTTYENGNSTSSQQSVPHKPEDSKDRHDIDSSRPDVAVSWETQRPESDQPISVQQFGALRSTQPSTNNKQVDVDSEDNGQPISVQQFGVFPSAQEEEEEMKKSFEFGTLACELKDRPDSLSGEVKQSDHEYAPSISSIVVNTTTTKDDRANTSSPKPEKRVNFSDQLVKRYPESPLDSKTFGSDAKFIKRDEDVRTTDVELKSSLEVSDESSAKPKEEATPPTYISKLPTEQNAVADLNENDDQAPPRIEESTPGTRLVDEAEQEISVQRFDTLEEKKADQESPSAQLAAVKQEDEVTRKQEEEESKRSPTRKEIRADNWVEVGPSVLDEIKREKEADQQESIPFTQSTDVKQGIDTTIQGSESNRSPTKKEIKADNWIDVGKPEEQVIQQEESTLPIQQFGDKQSDRTPSSPKVQTGEKYFESSATDQQVSSPPSAIQTIQPTLSSNEETSTQTPVAKNAFTCESKESEETKPAREEKEVTNSEWIEVKPTSADEKLPQSSYNQEADQPSSTIIDQSDQLTPEKRESIVSWLISKPKVEESNWVAPTDFKDIKADTKDIKADSNENAWITQGSDGNDRPINKTDASQRPSNSVKEESDQDQTIRRSYEADNNRDVKAELDAYEQRVIQNTQKALAMVDKLQGTLEEQERRKRHPFEGPLDSSHGEDQRRITRPPIAEFDDLEVEVYRVNPEMMEEPRSCVLLPDAKLLILDLKLGLTLMDLQSKETKRCAPDDNWRDVESACYMKKHNQILLVYEQKVDQQFHRYLGRFDLNLKMLSKCEAPKYILDKVVSFCRICYIDETDCIYLAVNTPNDCFLYELTPGCKWTEVAVMRGKQVGDICKLATVGPVTELLILESTKRHIHILCIYNSTLAERAILAFCAEPASLCVDELGSLIVFDRATNLVGVHSRLHFERIRELIVVGRANCSLSALDGHLAILNQVKKELRISKY